MDSESATILDNYKTIMQNNNCLTFYTDGLLVNQGMHDVIMGVGWIQTDLSTPGCCFLEKLEQWPSSTRTETMVILTALYTCPSKCKVTIITDRCVASIRFGVGCQMQQL